MRRRRKAEVDSTTADVEETTTVAGGVAGVAPGPYDAADVPADGIDRVDLGSMRIAPEEGYELRLQVDEASGTVSSVVLAGAEGVVELRAFAAPRNADFWSEARSQIASDIARRGGTATPREGRWGAELICQVPVQTPDGRRGTQQSRVLGINGPRWLLRATLLGKPAAEPEASPEWEDLISRVVVVRDGQAMPPGEALPVIMPPQARRVGD